MDQEQIDFESLNDDIPETCVKCGATVSLRDNWGDEGCADCLPFTDDEKTYPSLISSEAD